MMRKLWAVALFGVLAAGCAVDSGADDAVNDEAVAADEAALGYSNASFVQLYNANTKHMSEPGKPSYEGTDFTQLLAYMKQQTSLPDIVTLQEIGTKTSTFTSQSCQVFVDALERIVKPAGAKTHWSCIVAAGTPNDLGNANGGAAIVHRGRFQPSGPKDLVGLYYWNGGACTRQHAGTGWTALVQKFKDGAHTIAVASVHLPVASDGNGATADDCSGKNVALVKDALAATNADVKIIAGDMNHGDATRHLDASGTVVHDWWETSYGANNFFLNAHYPSNSGYRDAWFKECARGFTASATTTYTRQQTQAISTCLASEHWSINSGPKLDTRIDWVLVDGARSLTNARTIGFSDAHRAYLATTGKTNAPSTKYSDHRAQMLRVDY